MPNSRLASPRATREVMEEHGLATRKSLGQHFLVDDNVVGRILALAELSVDDTVLEVGPGIGTLTVALCAHAGAVVAVERDATLVPALEEAAADCERFALVLADAAKVGPEELSQPFGPPTALVSNLPYQVAATVVLRSFETMPLVDQATVMVQAEVADRMAADPGGKEYGAYTVKLRLRARPVGRFAVPRGCFMPPPRVDSAVLRLDRAPLSDDEGLIVAASAVADAAFAQRRKTVRNSLRASLDVGVETLDAVLADADVDGSLRAEKLAPERFLELASGLLERGWKP